MSRNTRRRTHLDLAQRFPPSEACDCETCRGYCVRPGWWTVSEAALAIEASYAGRMMLEISPERVVGVLSPAFKGCEGYFAVQAYARNGCTFYLNDGRCQLHGTGFEPLECRFCHHSRPGLGQECHTALECDWNTPAGQALVIRWLKLTGLWRLRRVCGVRWLK